MEHGVPRRGEAHYAWLTVPVLRALPTPYPGGRLASAIRVKVTQCDTKVTPMRHLAVALNTTARAAKYITSNVQRL